MFNGSLNIALKQKNVFENLIKKGDTTQEVKDEAQMGVFKMM